MNASLNHELYEGTIYPGAKPVETDADYDELVKHACREFAQIYDEKPNIVKAQGMTFVCHPNDNIPTFTVK